MKKMDRFCQQLSPEFDGTSTNRHSRLRTILFSAKALMVLTILSITSLTGHANIPLETEVAAPNAHSTSPSGYFALFTPGGGGNASLTAPTPATPAMKGITLERSFPVSVQPEEITVEESTTRQVLVVLQDQLGQEHFAMVKVSESSEGVLTGSASDSQITTGTYLVVASSDNKLQHRAIALD